MFVHVEFNSPSISSDVVPSPAAASTSSLGKYRKHEVLLKFFRGISSKKYHDSLCYLSSISAVYIHSWTSDSINTVFRVLTSLCSMCTLLSQQMSSCTRPVFLNIQQQWVQQVSSDLVIAAQTLMRLSHCNRSCRLTFVPELGSGLPSTTLSLLTLSAHSLSLLRLVNLIHNVCSIL